MTSTSIHQGMNENAKPSSKVLRPPGGGSSDIFGTGAPAAAPSPARVKAPPSSNIFGACESNGDEQAKPKHNRLKSDIFGQEAEPSPGGTRKSSRTYETNDKNDDEEDKEEDNNNANKPIRSKDVSNPITGETKSFAIGGAGEKVNRPSTRVHHPPGGASTKLW